MKPAKELQSPKSTEIFAPTDVCFSAVEDLVVQNGLAISRSFKAFWGEGDEGVLL